MNKDESGSIHLPEESEVKISESDLHEDRLSRFDLIHWWKRDKLASANILVIGAGALGNEILKNLALLGCKRILVVDMDDIETSNLSRSILFRPSDIGQPKAETAARATKEIFEEMEVVPLDANVMYGVGMGVFRWADVILAGLDNREARLWINDSAWKMNRPWIDGAIEGIDGVARVFVPGKPPCYGCTLGETDWQILQKRKSCILLTREDVLSGKTPTTPTTSSIIAGIQVQEAVKLIHDLPVLAGRGYNFEGLNHTSYTVTYTENENCQSHETYEDIVELSEKSSEMTLQGLMERAQADLGEERIQLNFSREIIHKLICPACEEEEVLFSPVGTISYEGGKCSRCPDSPNRKVELINKYTGKEDYGSQSLDSIGLPPLDLFVGRSIEREIAYLMAGDRESVLGPLALQAP